ncbi:hypothetical protein S40293_07831, partial [Stachybotrys chartarum IBT 40293]
MSNMSSDELQLLQQMGAPTPGTEQYEDWLDQSLQTEILVVAWIFLVLCIVFVGLRFYVRLRVYRRLLHDDYWLTAALAFGILSAILATLAVVHGNGRHMPALSEDDQSAVIMWTTAAFCPGILFLGLPKIAIVLLLDRLLDPTKFVRIFLWGIVGISQASFICLIGLLLGRCNPPMRLWDQNVEGECMDIQVVTNFAVFAGAFSAFVDVVLAVYPTMALFRTPMTLKRRLSLSVVLGIGLVGGAIAIYKTVLIPDGFGNPDFSYHSAPIMIWTAVHSVEGSTHVIAGSMPVLAPLLDALIRGNNPFRRSQIPDRAYDQFQKDSPDLSSGAYSQGGTAERGGSYGDSQVDILQTNEDGKEILDRNDIRSPTPGPGEILCTNEINITYERRAPPMEPLEAMVRGYDYHTWEN